MPEVKTRESAPLMVLNWLPVGISTLNVPRRTAARACVRFTFLAAVKSSKASPTAVLGLLFCCI